MRTWLCGALVLAACGSTSSPSSPIHSAARTPSAFAPSPECVAETERQIAHLVDSVADNIAFHAEAYAREMHGKAMYGAGAMLDADALRTFAVTPEGKKWICGINGFCASYRVGLLRQCDELLASATRAP